MSARVVYRLSVWISQPIADDDPEYYDSGDAAGRPRQAEVERDVKRVLAAGLPDFDVEEAEVQDADIEGEPDARDPDYERAAARAQANDFEDTDGRDWT